MAIMSNKFLLKKEIDLSFKVCALSYEYDTKGFLRPVYRFGGYINDMDCCWESCVGAMR